MTNPEAAVIDAIDALVDEQLRQVKSGYDYNINQDHCDQCGGDWHGLARLGCPGAFTTERRPAPSRVEYGHPMRPPGELWPRVGRRIEFPADREVRFLRPMVAAFWRDGTFSPPLEIETISASWHIDRADPDFIEIRLRCHGTVPRTLYFPVLAGALPNWRELTLFTHRIDDAFSVEFIADGGSIRAEMVVNDDYR